MSDRPAHDRPRTTTRATAAPTAANDPTAIDCPHCGHPMHGVKGSRHAICGNCGFKDACCY